MLRPVRQNSTPPRKIPSQENVLDRIVPMGFDPDEGRNYLFYGESGTGKTTLWSSFPGPILCIVCSGGLKPGELLSIDTKVMREKIDTVVLRSPNELDMVTGAIDRGDLVHSGTKKPYRCVVLDHASGFQTLKLAAYKGWEEIPQVKKFGDANKKEWGEISAAVIEHLAKLMTLKCNVIIIAQERIFLPNSDDPGREVKMNIALSGVIKPKVGAALMPSVTSWLNPASDYVVQTFIRQRTVIEEQVTKIAGKEHLDQVKRLVDGIEFCARTGKHEIFMTKFRVGDAKPPEAIVLGDTITGVKKSPTGYEQLMKIIKGVEQR